MTPELVAIGLSALVWLLAVSGGFFLGVAYERRQRARRHNRIRQRLVESGLRPPIDWDADEHPGCIGPGCQSRLHSQYGAKR